MDNGGLTKKARAEWLFPRKHWTPWCFGSTAGTNVLEKDHIHHHLFCVLYDGKSWPIRKHELWEWLGNDLIKARSFEAMDGLGATSTGKTSIFSARSL